MLITLPTARGVTPFAAKLAFACAIFTLGCASSARTAEGPVVPQREPTWISGEVMGVDRIPIDQYNDSTVHLVVSTEAPETVDLELAPGWYVDEQGLAFQPNQRIEYRGHSNTAGKFTVYEIRRGDATIQLRDETGAPRWQPRQ